MRCPPNKAVQVLHSLYVEMDINSMHYLIAQNILNHLLLNFALTSIVVLNSRGMPRHVAVFTAAQQYHFFEVAQVTLGA